ncbi:MAG: PEP-CTERM sorting domain-containing protein [Planctomycetota bacterium]
MKRLCYHAAACGLVLSLLGSTASADVAFSAGPPNDSFVEGQAIYTFTLAVSPTEGEVALDGIRFAVSIEEQTGSGTAAFVGNPELSGPFSSGFSVDFSALPTQFADTVRAANVFATTTATPDASLVGGFEALQFTIDTSNLVAGDTFVIDTNPSIGGGPLFGQATLDGLDFGVVGSQTIVTVTAIPEPSSLAFIGVVGASGFIVTRRRSRDRG